MSNNKTFATAVLAAVAIVMTITALSLVSPQSSWDGALLTDINLDLSLTAATTTPNTPDVWSAFDAVSDTLSSDWLIPPAFANITSINVNGIAYEDYNTINVTTTEGTSTTLSVIATSNITIIYEWLWHDPDQPADFQNLNTSAITFTAPTVDEDSFYFLTVYVDDADGINTINIDLTVLDADNTTNAVPTVDAGGPLSVTLESSVTPNPVVNDSDSLANHMYTWTSSNSSAVNFSDADSLRPLITVPANITPANVTLTLTVVDGEHTVSDTTTLRIFDPNVNVEPTVSVGDDIIVKERTSVTLTGTAHDPNPGDTLKYSWDHNLDTDIVVTGNDTKSLRFTAPGISSDEQPFVFTLTVTDSENLTASDEVTVTVEDVPLKVSSAVYYPGNGQLRITFNQNIDSNPVYSDIHIRSTGSNDNVITLSAPESTHHGRTITATLSSEQKEAYADLTRPQLYIDRGAVTDQDGVATDEPLSIDISTVSKKKKSSSYVPIVDLNTLANARIVDIPPEISEQVSSHDVPSDPLEPILHDDTFDFPLAINEYYYLLDDTTNTLTRQTVTAGQTTEIEFTVYTEEDLAHFTLYLNMQGSDVNYAYSDTYITYVGDGTVTVTDPHGYIAHATITITQEDDSVPERRAVLITVEFEEQMGLTNMVAYMWNTDRKASFVNLIDAIEVVAPASEEEEDIDNNSNASTTGSGPAAADDSERDATNDDDDGNTHSDTNSLVANADDDAQTLLLVRAWSGFEPELISDADLLESLNLDYPKVDIPAWMMTELGVLVSNGDVTVKEFKTALLYMLDSLTS